MALFGKRRKTKARLYVIDETPAPGAGAPATAVVVATSARARAAARARNRIGMCAVAFLAAFVGLGARLAMVAGGGAPSPGAAPTAQAGAESRPEILDRNGVLLAANVPTVALEIAGREVWDPEETAAAIAGVFPEIDAASLAGKLREGRYVEVLNDLTPAQRAQVFALGLPGVRFSARARRFYPQEDLAAHVVGHLTPGRGGAMGLERALDRRADAGPLVASIDIRVQQALEDELARAMEAFSAKAAWGAVMDVATGEVLALASLPDFDPNAPGAAPADWRRNRATYDRYELGSAFKPLTAAAALEAGAASEDSTYDARGTYRIADWTIRDFRGENRILTFSEVIQHSSNIGMARMAEDLGPARQRAALKALGLLDPLPIELAENRAPEPPARWGPVESATVAYGHGISVTPLHLLAAFAAVVNGGEYRAPTFLKQAGARPGARVFSEETSAIMRRTLRRVVTGGSARKAEAPGYYPIGKTATAEKPRRGGYDRSARIASFVGAFPGHAPRYAVLVSLDEPQPTPETYGFATAGWNAAPAFARFVARAAPALGIAPVNEATALAGFYEGGRSVALDPADRLAALENAP
ncbi:peptidoglycan D,D-transpeptidase FtsI family protein [Amphiplicatus metriothermophilus]|uniref:Cell division protein FtsI (Penicillin-binding protein 3) n=1 Tax=Amphiplicatus metriothermophilus TaxID=1519374 RepID=A0A239PTT2_9PROT|nr:penicillin-binding protein 2 [Amphiplicatus metriothermophilus]MBB5519247.1 cell division protein FtsI (penicillin-binding protein 3) [Amphiplicatus metriothermophilus]SNT73316.1 cell division protein FtsI (penicillin-binding protein 3) [Amphiplicatus metriothermophilus]